MGTEQIKFHNCTGAGCNNKEPCGSNRGAFISGQFVCNDCYSKDCPRPPGPTRGDIKIGIFNPKRRDTLRPRFEALIGLEFKFEYLWTMDDRDPFPGQVAWLFSEDNMLLDGFPRDLIRWVPEEDIDPA